MPGGFVTQPLLCAVRIYYERLSHSKEGPFRNARTETSTPASPPTCVVATIIEYEVSQRLGMPCPFCVLVVCTAQLPISALVEEIVAKVNGDIITRSEIDKPAPSDWKPS